MKIIDGGVCAQRALKRVQYARNQKIPDKERPGNDSFGL